MRAVHAFLDNLNTCAKDVERATRRKKRTQRKRIIAAVRVARLLANAIAAVVPKAIPVAVVLNGIAEFTPEETQKQKSKKKKKKKESEELICVDCTRTQEAGCG